MIGDFQQQHPLAIQRLLGEGKSDGELGFDPGLDLDGTVHRPPIFEDFQEQSRV